MFKNYQKYFKCAQKLAKIFLCVKKLRKIFAKTTKSVKNGQKTGKNRPFWAFLGLFSGQYAP